ncbi:MAG TPA: tetratricopeptide repeat protein [Thermoanaerobaculia bacterium]|nr:tetratricopeptide repeat protein [Thermoanaerobaculia bacterium]
MLFLADLLPLPGNLDSPRERLRRATLRSLPAFAASLAVTFVFAGNLITLFTHGSILQRTELRLAGYGQVLANVAASWLEAVRLLFFPLTLSVDYPLQPTLELTSTRAMLGILLAVLWVIVTVLLLYRAPTCGFALAWVLVMYAPISNLVPLVPFGIAERYLYVPSFGVCLLVGLAIDRGIAAAQASHLRWGKGAAVGLAALVLAAGAARSFVRIGDWHDDRALWSSAMRAGFDSWRIQMGMGNVRWQESHPREAIGYYQRALDSGPLPMAVRRSLVANLWSCGGTREVVSECQRILRDDPGEWECHLLLAEAARRAGNDLAAVQQYRSLLARDAGNSAGLRELAFVLATSRDPQLRDLPQALQLATRALKASRGADPEVLNVLAIVNGEAGDLAAAVRWARQGYDLANRQGNPAEATRIERTLRSLAYASAATRGFDH